MNNKNLLNLIDITVSFEGFLALNKLNLNLSLMILFCLEEKVLGYPKRFIKLLKIV